MRRMMLMLMVCCVVGFAQAAPTAITVTNPGFEDPAAGKITGFDDVINDVPGWQDVGTNADSGVEPATWYGVHSGAYAAWFESESQGNPGAYQMTGHTIAANEVFTVGFWATNVWDGSELTVTLFGDNVATPADELGSYAATVGTGSGGGGGVYNYFEVKILAPAGSVGKELGIKFVNTGTVVAENWVAVDDVTLSYEIPTYVVVTDPAQGDVDVAVDLSDRDISGNVSWSAPPAGGSTAYDIYIDPNEAKVYARNSHPDGACQFSGSTTSGVTQFAPGSNLDWGTTYYMIIDADGQTSEPNAISFATISAAPNITSYDSVVVTQSLLPASVSAVVTDADGNLSTSTFTVLTDDVEWPNPGSYTLTPNTTDPYAPSFTFTADTPGYYKVKLTADDGTTATEDIAEVAIYADPNACEAAQFGPSWPGFNVADIDEDCDVDLNDFAEMALGWLDDRNLAAPDYYDWSIPYTPVNTIQNGDFETGDLFGWGYSEEATVTSASPINGTYSCVLDGTVDLSTGVIAYVPVEAGKSYTFECKVLGGQGSDGTTGDQVQIRRGLSNLVRATWTPSAVTPVTVTTPTYVSTADEELEFVIWSTDGSVVKVDDAVINVTP